MAHRWKQNSLNLDNQLGYNNVIGMGNFEVRSQKVPQNYLLYDVHNEHIIGPHGIVCLERSKLDENSLRGVGKVRLAKVRS